jgi:hypothetical protein
MLTDRFDMPTETIEKDRFTFFKYKNYQITLNNYLHSNEKLKIARIRNAHCIDFWSRGTLYRRPSVLVEIQKELIFINSFSSAEHP